MERYEPRKPDRRFITFTSRAGIAVVALMWLLKRKFGIDSSTMCILTGIAIFNLVMNINDRKTVEKNYLCAKAVRENKQTIDSGDIGGDDIIE